MAVFPSPPDSAESSSASRHRESTTLVEWKGLPKAQALLEWKRAEAESLPLRTVVFFTCCSYRRRGMWGVEETHDQHWVLTSCDLVS